MMPSDGHHFAAFGALSLSPARIGPDRSESKHGRAVASTHHAPGPRMTSEMSIPSVCGTVLARPVAPNIRHDGIGKRPFARCSN